MQLGQPHNNRSPRRQVVSALLVATLVIGASVAGLVAEIGESCPAAGERFIPGCQVVVSHCVK